MPKLKSKLVHCLAIALAVLPSGCSVFSDGSPTRVDQELIPSQAKSDSDSSKGQIVNPPARTIRFDGHEIVLGQAEPTELTPDKLLSMLQPLVTGQRYRTASALILLHRETAERLLSERWATDYEDASVQLIANVLSSRSARAENSWIALLRIARERPTLAKPYQTARNAFALQLQTADPTNEQATQLQQWRLTLTIHSSKSTACACWACANCWQVVRPGGIAMSSSRRYAYNSGNVSPAAELSC